jgi:uncharacterized protein (DUF1800 family)
MSGQGMSATPSDLGFHGAVYLLDRLGYGPRPGQAREILDQGLDRWVRDQLSPGPDPELDTRLAPLTTLGFSVSQVLDLYARDQSSTGVILDQLALAKIVRAVHGKNQLREVLVDFWFNHFNVFVGDDFARYAIAAYERDAIRPHVFGRFRDMLGATAQHPAMLAYLDNYLSTVVRVVGGRHVGGLNENYGRELLELHTVGVDAGYTQSDVIDSARSFTGWTIDGLRAGGNFIYRPANHDAAAKTIFGLSLAAGGGQDDGESLLDYLAAHPKTAAFISRKLAQRFVADDPPASLVDKMASTFLASGGDLARVTEAMIGSVEFWGPAFDGSPGKTKSPVEFAFSALRAAGANVTATRGTTAALNQMGMPLYGCLPPTGYSNRGDDWVNPSSHLARMNFGIDLATNGVVGAHVDAREVVRSGGGNPDDARSSATALSEFVFGRTVGADTLATASRVGANPLVSVAARVLGLLLAGPEMQSR